MVMMQSPISDIPQPASPCSSNPGSPKMNNNTNESKYHKYESIRLERPQPTTIFDGLLLARFHEHDENINDIKNRPLMFPKDTSDMDSHAKYSIERLKQLTDHSINRLSPSEDSNTSMKYTLDQKYSNLSPTSTKGCGGGAGSLGIGNNNNNNNGGVGVENDTNNLHHHHNNSQLSHHHFPIKYPSNTSQLDIERIKLSRTITNGKDLSDFGFRIQLGGLHTNYARSDTSEELVVDGNDENSSQEAPTVSELLLIIFWK